MICFPILEKRTHKHSKACTQCLHAPILLLCVVSICDHYSELFTRKTGGVLQSAVCAVPWGSGLRASDCSSPEELSNTRPRWSQGLSCTDCRPAGSKGATGEPGGEHAVKPAWKLEGLQPAPPRFSWAAPAKLTHSCLLARQQEGTKSKLTQLCPQERRRLQPWHSSASVSVGLQMFWHSSWGLGVLTQAPKPCCSRRRAGHLRVPPVVCRSAVRGFW